MKIVFFSHDDELEEFLQDAVTTADMVMTDAEDDAIAEVDEALEDEVQVALFLDFDTNRKVAEKINKHYLKEKELLRVIFTADMSVKELKKHQDSKLGAHAYMRKPLTSESISELLMDLDWAQSAVFEYESTDELFDSIPEGSEDTSYSDESSSSDANFSASELKMDTEVRRQLDRHHFNPEQAFDFSHPTNLKVQAAFDSVFGAHDLLKKGSGTQEQEEAGFDDLLGDDEMDSDESDDAVSVVFNFNEDHDETGEAMSAGSDDSSDEKQNPRTILEQMESEREASLVGYRPPVLEPTGDIEVPEEFRTATAEETLLEEDEEIQEEISEQDEEGLQFALPEDDQDETASGPEGSAQSDDEEEEGLSFEMDEQEDLDLSGAGEEEAEDVSAPESLDKGDLDLGMDEDEGALEFSAASDEEQEQVLSEEEPSAEEGGLELGEDGGDLELGADEDLEASSEDADEDDGFGQLDLSSGDEDDEELGKTVVMNTDDVGLNFGLPSEDEDEAQADEEAGEDLLAGVDEGEELSFGEEDEATSEESFEATGKPVDLDDALTGITQNGLEEFDYSAGKEEDFSASAEDDFSDLGELSEEGTDPTLMASVDEFMSMPKEDQEEVGASESSDSELAGLNFSDDVDDIDDEVESEDELRPEMSANEDQVEAAVENDILGELDTAPAPGRSALAQSEAAASGRDPILVKTYAEEEMVRHQGLIRQLREEREDFLKQIQELKTQARLLESENLGLRAELDELKIEKSIMKKRHQGELEETNYALKLADEKRQIFEERARKVQKEFDKLNQKIRIDFNAVKLREKELEGQLELLKMDSQSQVESRDRKILELKRKIDALEFNMENAHIKEQKSKEDKHKLEDKLHRVMKTLRTSIKVMEDDLEVENLLNERTEDIPESERE